LIYGYFPSIPLILVITLHNMKTIFCVFWRFRSLPELKLTWDFSGINILSRKSFGAQEVNEGGHEAHLSMGGAGLRHGRATMSRLRLEPLMSPMFVAWISSWPKNTYIKATLGVPRGGNGEKRNIETKAVPVKIGGGNAAEVTPGRLSNLSNITTIDTAMKRE
jgi:hypothetical protein